MKTINVTFTDEEHARLVNHKEFLGANWNDYILECTEFARKETEKFHEFHHKEKS